MRITKKIIWDMESGRILVHEHEQYFGPFDLCCCGGDSTASALEKSQAAMTNTLNQSYETTFGEQQQLLAQQTAKLNYIAANPMGYTPAQLATATTAINENAATAGKQAIGAAAAYAGAHGGADTGSGAAGEIAGQIGSAVTEGKAQSLASLSEQNEGLKQKNFWNAISGLNSVGSELGGAGGTALGGAGNAAESSVNAGKLALESQQAQWGDIGGVVSGIASLGTAGVGAFNSLGAGGSSGGGGGEDPYY